MELDPNLNAFRDDLADASLKDRVTATRYTKGWRGKVITGIAPVWQHPDLSSEVVTHFHHGEELNIFDVSAGLAWCQSCRDGYVGYVNETAVSEASSYSEHAFVVNLGSYVYPQADLRIHPLDFYPRHSVVNVVERGLMTRDTSYARLSNNCYIPENCLEVAPARCTNIISSARRYKGTPYLWGGRSYLGIDCAGLVQNVCEDIGVSVLRDTYMQVKTLGREAGPFSIDLLQAGDFIYIPGHVMIYTGDRSVVHADGRTMNVIEEDLDALIEQRNLRLNIFTIRRLPQSANV